MDWALERGDEKAVREVQHASECWNRPPEEWELYRDKRPWVRIAYSDLARSGAGDWVEIDGHSVNADTLRRLLRGDPDDIAPFFRELGFEARLAHDGATIEMRPLPFRVRFRNGALAEVHPPRHGKTEAQRLAIAHEAHHIAAIRETPGSVRRVMQFLDTIPDGGPVTPLQGAAFLATYTFDPGADALRRSAEEERARHYRHQDGFTYARSGLPPGLHPPRFFPTDRY
jgi:hypothetical protein